MTDSEPVCGDCNPPPLVDIVRHATTTIHRCPDCQRRYDELIARLNLDRTLAAEFAHPQRFLLWP